MDKYLYFDSKAHLFADVTRHIVAGRLIINIKVKTNVKIVCANSNILVEVYYDSVDEKYMRSLHHKGGANIYTSSDDGLYSIFSFNLN